MNTKLIFIGPTLVDSSVEIKNLEDLGYDVLPPIKRGDLSSIPNIEFIKRIVIVDGVFRDFPAVGHKEILNILKLGCDVWGLSSMGAIRASEMDVLGMNGFGKVYNLFKENNYDDDEVALLFAPKDFNYKSISEPLIHFRIAISDLVKQALINQEEKNEMIKKLKNMWFGNRTLGYYENLLSDLNITEDKKLIAIKEFNKYRIKSQDFTNFILEHG